MKGICGTFGATRLANHFKQFDQALKEANLDVAQKCIDALSPILPPVIEQLKTWRLQATVPATANAQEPMSKADALALIEELQVLVAEMDPNAMPLAEQLYTGMPDNDVASQIVAALDAFDFDEAELLLPQLSSLCRDM